MFVCVFVRVFTFEVPFKHLFAPTSQSWMSNIFRNSESVWKSNGKKWSQNKKKKYLDRVCIRRAKKVFFAANLGFINH